MLLRIPKVKLIKYAKGDFKFYLNMVLHVVPLESRYRKASSRPRTEVRFARFLSSGFITAIVVNPPEMKLAKRTSVDWSTIQFLGCY